MPDWTEVSEPKIWVSRFMTNLSSSTPVDWECEGDKLEFIHGYKYLWKKASSEGSPTRVFFEANAKIPNSAKDAFKIIDGLLLISPELKEILKQINIGETQLFEVPFHENQKGDDAGLPNHFVLNVHAPRKTLIPELSTNLRQQVVHGDAKPKPDAPWFPNYDKDDLAVMAVANGEYDLWHDPNLRQRFFLSDRLKQALDNSGLKLNALDIHPTRVFIQA